MRRDVYDLSHFSFMSGKMGRLMTLALIPNVAGDSIGINFRGIFRLSPLRRNLVVDAHCDLYVFWVPHRHVYGDDWINFIKQGVDEAITFDTVDYTGTNGIEYLGAPRLTGVNPLWPLAGYNRIWNRYFRVPTDTSAVLADTAPGTDADTQAFGRLCARIKSIWSTGIDETTDVSDREVSTAGNVMDILSLRQIQARYQSEQTRDYFGQRYNDLLKATWGSNVNIDADERPQMLWKSQNFLSGYDVDGTGDATLGQYSGKSVGTMSFDMPRRYLPEHGALYVMALLRFPTIHINEIHYLHNQSQPTYKQISGDPEVWKGEPPLDHEVQDFFAGSSDSTDLGHMPYGQWYRWHPHTVHDQFRQLQGFTFGTDDPTSKDTARYVQATEYNDTFANEALAQWHSQARIGVIAARPITSALQSIYAGV